MIVWERNKAAKRMPWRIQFALLTLGKDNFSPVVSIRGENNPATQIEPIALAEARFASLCSSAGMAPVYEAFGVRQLVVMRDGMHTTMELSSVLGIEKIRLERWAYDVNDTAFRLARAWLL